MSSPCNLFIIFYQRNMKRKKKISALVKMWNRCSNNDWRQLMLSGRSNRLGVCLASDFYSKQTRGKCKCEIKVLFFRGRKKNNIRLHCCAFLLWSDSLDLFSKIIKNNGSKMLIEQLWRVSRWYFLLNHQTENVLGWKWLWEGRLARRMKMNVCV